MCHFGGNDVFKAKINDGLQNILEKYKKDKYTKVYWLKRMLCRLNNLF
jgi:hypothetical protein